MNSICVFCGSSLGGKPVFKEAARAMGRALAKRGVGVVYGGGNIGLMGVVADAAMQAGGRVVGVIPQALADKELAHQGITELHIVDSMHSRKAMMAELSDGFVALPGGYGTFEELCEIITWGQLGIHSKPCAVLNIDGYYDALLRQFDHGVEEGFILPAHRELVLSSNDVEQLLELMIHYSPPNREQWIDQTET